MPDAAPRALRLKAGARELLGVLGVFPALSELGAGDTRLIMNIFGDSSRVLSNKSSARVLELEAEGITDYEAYRPHVQGILQKEAYVDGDWNKGTASIGQSVAFAGDIEPVETIIDGIIAEAAAVRDRLNSI